MSQYPESDSSFRGGATGPASTGQYRTGSLAGTGQFATGQYGGNPAGTGQFAVGPDAEARRRAAAEAAVNAFPRHVVTAVLVSHDGARWLDDSLKGLLGQLRAPQRVLAVDTGSKDDSLAILDESLGPEAVLQAKRNTGFGTAVNHALKQAAPATYDDYPRGDLPLVEWIWLLHDDAEPAPDALLRLLEVGDAYPDAGVVGPKIRGWYDREQLLEVGVTVTADGRRWTGLEEGEHDQGQHAEPTKVLSVSSAGMLIRRDVWDRLRGFDRAIPMFRDDLDFCWRVNNAGLDVLTAPKALLWHAEAAARSERRISAGVSRPHFEDRQHALYALTANHAGRFLPLTFLRLFLWSLLRAFGLLLNKTPLKAADEILAAFAYAGRIDRIIRARRARRKTRAPRPVDLSPLFPSRMAVFRLTFEETTQGFRRRINLDENEGGGSHESGPVSEEAESFDSGTPWLIRAVRMPGNFIGLSLLVLMLVSAREVLTGGRLMGGALLPAPAGASDLWSAFFSAWHPVGTGSTSPAPPYLAVVATVATLLFGHASLAVTVLLLGSVPLAGLTAYAVLRRTVDANPLKIWGALAYALLPAVTGAISGGRLGSAVGIVLLPLAASGVLLAIGGPGRSGSMRAAWPAAFAIAVGMAFAPIVWVLAAVLAAGATLTVFWRSTADFATVLIRLAVLLVTPIAVLAPWSLQFLAHPLAFLLEPGLPTTQIKTPSPAVLLLANPGGPGTFRYWLTAGLLVAALAALVRSGPRRRIVFAGWTLALAGFAAGLLALQTHPTALAGGLPQQPWTGVPTAAIGFGLIVAAVIGAEGARDYFQTAHLSWRQPVALLLALGAVLAPVGAAISWLTHGVDGPVQRAAADFRPAVVSVKAHDDEQPRALILGSGAQTVVGYGVVRGDGAQLGDADYTLPQASVDRMNALVGGLLSNSGGGEINALATAGIQYVVGMKTLPIDYVRILDATPGLNRLSDIEGVQLWKLSTPVARLTLRASAAGGAATPAPTPSPSPAPAPVSPPPPSGKTPAPGAKTPAPGAKAPAPSAAAGTPSAAASAQGGQAQQPSTTPATPDPNALTIDSMGTSTAKAEIPAAAADGRVLVLAEDYDSHWKASMGGTDLKPVTVDGWAQGFQVPAAGGTVTLSYSSLSRDGWLAAEGMFFLFAVIMALPTGRTAEEPGPVGDDYQPARGDLQARRGRRGVPSPEPEPVGVEPEYEPEPVYEAEPAAEYAGRRRGTGEFPRPGTGEYARPGTGEYARPGSGEYARPGYDVYGSGEQERPSDYGQYDSYGRRTTGEYERPGSGEYERPGSGEYQRPGSGEYAQPAEYVDPYVQQYSGSGEHERPAEYGGYLRPGSGEYERPDFENPDEYDGYGPQGGYR